MAEQSRSSIGVAAPLGSGSAAVRRTPDPDRPVAGRGVRGAPDAETATETVWISLGAVPVFAYDLNLGDEVEVIGSAEGPLVAVRPLHDAGRGTFRVLFPHADDPDDRSWVALWQQLEPFGCWFDVYTPQLVAVSADAAVAQEAADFLAEEQRTGRWVYETGRSVLPGTRS